LGKGLKVRGLMNIQYAVKDDVVYVLEVNPRASRTVPYVSKAIGKPIAQIATKVMTGMSLKDLNFTKEITISHYAVKEAVLPFLKFPGAQITLGPEMRSTGEVMGIDPDYGLAFLKSQAGAGCRVPEKGGLFISVNDQDKPLVVDLLRRFQDLGFTLYATTGTHKYLQSQGIETQRVLKVSEGRPHVVDFMIDKSIDLIINTPMGVLSQSDEKAIRSNAISRDIPLVTTLAAAYAVADGLEASKTHKVTIKALQDYHQDIPA
jgi:carbamoyl-phosphate synthase large subunit